MSESWLTRVRVVLYEPQNVINIAATVRAMKNFGVQDLVLVRPTPYTAYRVEGIAHDTLDIIERIRDVDTLDDALGDATYIAAFSARRRRANWDALTPRDLATAAAGHAADGQLVLMFGREDDGLPNEALDRAHARVTIPTTEHASLNLAQAVVVALYELHVAAGDATRRVAGAKHQSPPASGEQFERLFVDQERALEAVEFFKTRHRTHIMRSARRLAYRTLPDAREIMLMRAMWIEVVRALNRFRRMAGLAEVPFEALASHEEAAVQSNDQAPNVHPDD